MFQECLQASAASENKHRAWRITLAGSMEKERVESRKAQEKERDVQQEMLVLLKQQTELLQALADLQVQQAHAHLPPQPIENPVSHLHIPQGIRGPLHYPNHSTLGDIKDNHSFPYTDL
ncbi:unnamed protein product [Caretta caretta]